MASSTQRQATLFSGAAPSAEVLAILAELPEPHGPEVLYDLAREAGLGAGDVVFDVGARGVRDAVDLASEFGCRVVALDLVAGGLVGASAELESSSVGHLVWRVQADAEMLPMGSSTLDAIWARDMLSCVDPTRLLAEAARVLRPGGWVILHAVYLTSLLEGAERQRFVSALSLTDGTDREIVEAAVRQAGFAVVRAVDVGAGWRERELVAAEPRLVDDLLTVIRMQRASGRLIERVGREWYETILAWRQWAVFIALGKLEMAAYLLRLP